MGGLLLQGVDGRGPVAFHRPGRDISAAAHGDDFAFTGVDDELDFALQLLEKRYEIKSRRRLGRGPGDGKEIGILSRIVRFHDWGISWEAGGRHRQIIKKYFGRSEGSKA